MNQSQADQFLANNPNDERFEGDEESFADQNDSLNAFTNGQDQEANKCPYCICSTTVKATLNRHIRTKHTHKNEKSFKCGKCCYATNRKDNLIRHERTCKN